MQTHIMGILVVVVRYMYQRHNNNGLVKKVTSMPHNMKTMIVIRVKLEPILHSNIRGEARV